MGRTPIEKYGILSYCIHSPVGYFLLYKHFLMALPNILGTPQQWQAQKDIANMYWQVPAHIAAGLGKAALGLYAGARELENTWDYSKSKSAFMSMLSKDLG